MDQSKLGPIKTTLEAERDALERQLADYGVKPGDEGIGVRVDEGFADSAQATAERSEMLSMVEQLQRNHAEVAAALEAMDEGTYGRCRRCGKEISPERLEAMPKSTLCVSCKEAEAGR